MLIEALVVASECRYVGSDVLQMPTLFAFHQRTPDPIAVKAFAS